MTKEVEVKTKFDALYIDPVALKKIQYWTDAADGEVSGLGIVEHEDGRMIVKELLITGKFLAIIVIGSDKALVAL